MKKYKIKYQDRIEIKELIIETEDIKKYSLPKNVLSIKLLNKFELKNLTLNKKIEQKHINLIFYELDLMLSAGINFNDAINILIKNKKEKNIREFLFKLKDIVISTENPEKAFEKFNINHLVSSFMKLALKKGNIALNIKALNLLLNETTQSKKEFVKSIRYPIVLIISFLISLLSIFYFVIPKFQIIFEQTNSELPLATKVLLFTHFIFEDYIIYILVSIFLLVLFLFYYYKKNYEFRYFIHRFFIEKLFLFKDVYLSFEVYKIFLVIDIMQKSGYEFHNALSSSKVLLKNQYLLDKISLIENLLQNGKSISYSFSKTNLFDDMILNLINTAEVSNSLDITVEEIKKIYKNRFDEKIKSITTLVEPVFLITIMGLIVWIVLAIFMPIWDMGNMIKI